MPIITKRVQSESKDIGGTVLQELLTLSEGWGSFDKDVRTTAAKLLGVAKAKKATAKQASAWYDLEDGDFKLLKTETIDTVEHFGDDDDDAGDGQETLELLQLNDGTKIVRSQYNDWGGGDDPRFYIPA